MTLLLVLSLSSTVFADKVVQHTVRSGESVTKIARQYGVSISQVLGENNIVNADRLSVGQVLSITVPDDEPTPTPAPASSPTPAAAPSESPNPPADPAAEEQDAAQPPKAATDVPATPVAPTAIPQPVSVGCNQGIQAGDFRYTVRSGDSLYRLASWYGVTVAAIKSRNCMTSDMLMVGQSIIIPLGVANSGATSVPTATSRSTGDSPATATPTPRPTATRPAPTATPTPAPTADTRSWLDRLLNR